jgi:aspartate aminotransferase-like enzyme
MMRPPRPREDVRGAKRRSPKATHVRIAGGQDSVKGKIFRPGHMGTVSTEELAGGIGTIERVLAQQGAPIKRGAWSDAFAAGLG